MKIESEIRLLEKIRQVMVDVGIYEYSHLGFGTCLGAVRPTKRSDLRYHIGLMEHDHDADICHLAENYPPGKIEEYFELCKKRGLFNWGGRSRSQRKPNGEFVWFSLKEKTHGSRCCQWFTYPWKGFRWHSKGKRWIDNEKFSIKKFNYNSSYDAIAKGTPEKYYQSLMEIDFEGMKMNVPATTGSLLDCWYPGWSVPRTGGASRKNIVCLIKDWGNEKTWRLR